MFLSVWGGFLFLYANVDYGLRMIRLHDLLLGLLILGTGLVLAV